MGGIAQRETRRVHLTTDNPRRASVEDIIADIRRGMKDENVVVELDRERALPSTRRASGRRAGRHLLGKGVEDYQIIGAEKHPWSDRRAAEEGLTHVETAVSVRTRTWVRDALAASGELVRAEHARRRGDAGRCRHRQSRRMRGQARSLRWSRRARPTATASCRRVSCRMRGARGFRRRGQ